MEAELKSEWISEDEEETGKENKAKKEQMKCDLMKEVERRAEEKSIKIVILCLCLATKTFLINIFSSAQHEVRYWTCPGLKYSDNDTSCCMWSTNFYNENWIFLRLSLYIITLLTVI